jgi:lipopolysaccharide export system permease protein
MRAARQIIHIKQYSPDEQRVAGITIHTFDDNFQLIERVDAEQGSFEKGQWQLSDAVKQRFVGDSGGHQLSLHATLLAVIDLNPEDLARAAKRSDEMGLAELGRYIEKVEREGYSATRYRVDYHGKIAAPFVCLFLSVLGAGVALRGKLREGMPVSIIYGLGIAFTYWIFNSFCLSLGYAETMPPVVAAWIANLVFSCASGFILLNAN